MKTRGYTLIELLSVIAIISIIASVVLVGFDGARERSRDGERVSEVAQIQLALESYYNACRLYPSPTSNALSTSATDTGCPTGVTLGTYLKTKPTDPLASADYYYAVNATKSTYVLRALLESNDKVLVDDVDTIPSGVTVSGGCEDGPDGDGRYRYCVSP